jgi:hypothetical protein
VIAGAKEYGWQLQALIIEPNIRYYPETDTMAFELRPDPMGPGGDPAQIGGQDEAEDLVVHYAADGEPWMWEIDHASKHPEHIAAALLQIRRNATAA